MTARSDYNLSRADRASSLHAELFTEVKLTNFCVFSEITRRAGAEYFSFGHDVSAVRHAQRLTHIVIRDEDSDAATAQVENHALNIIDRFWIDSGKGFVQQNELRLGRQ